MIPHQRLPEYDDIPGQIICRSERYQSGMFLHSSHCPREPLDKESRARLEEIEEQLDHWMSVKGIKDCAQNKESFRQSVLILVRVPRSIYVTLLEKAKGMGVPLHQYC